MKINMNHLCDDSGRGKPKPCGGKTPVPVSLCPPQISRTPNWDRTRGSAVTDQRLEPRRYPDLLFQQSHVTAPQSRTRCVPPVKFAKYVPLNLMQLLICLEAQQQVSPLLPVARACRSLSVARWRDCVLHTAACTGYTASGY